MSGKRRKGPREKDLTSRYLTGGYDEDRAEAVERFSDKNKGFQQGKIERTAELRASEEGAAENLEALPLGQVVQVYSLFYEVEHEGRLWLCVLRKTLSKLLETGVVVGDWVRFRETGATDEQGRPEAVIEQVLPRKTILTRADSFKAVVQHPIVANAEQMLIVVSLHEPDVRWGLVDRMLVAAQAGKLRPIVCLNKIDLAGQDEEGYAFATSVLAHYSALDITCIQSSVEQDVGLEELRKILREKITVLAGHSGVGKSSLVRAVQPSLDLKIGAISGWTGKGRHTTTSARKYDLEGGGRVIDTPGVKLFGLWGVTRDNLAEFFPDVFEETSPPWRVESYQRILESLPEDMPGESSAGFRR